MKMFNDPLYRKSLIIMVSTLIGGVLNYLFNPLVARLLTTAQYGELLAMFAVLNVIAIPANTNSIVTTQYVSRYLAVGDEDTLRSVVRKMYRQATVASVILTVLFLALIPVMAHFFYFSSNISLILLAISIPAAFIYPVVQGVIQGRQLFTKLSMVSIMGPVLKIVVVVIAIVLGFQLVGIVGLLSIVTLIVMYVAYLLVRMPRTSHGASSVAPAIRELLRRGSYALLANVGLAILINIDLFITKRYLSPDLAGQYGTVSLLGKAIYFFGGSLALVLFPMAVSRHAKNESSMSIVKKALAAIALITACCVALFSAESHFIVRLLFGERYLNFAPMLWQTGVVFGLYSIIHILVMYFLATTSRRFLFPLLAGCMAIPVVFTVGAHTVQALLNVMMVTFAVVVCLLLFLLKRVQTDKDQPGPIAVIEPTL